MPDGYAERALYIARGEVECGGQRHIAGQMIVVDRAQSSVRALQPSTVMVLGGDPLGERLLYWNFVSSSHERLEQAAADWRAGRMKLPDADDQEFIPLPDGPVPSAPAMS